MPNEKYAEYRDVWYTVSEAVDHGCIPLFPHPSGRAVVNANFRLYGSAPTE